MNTVPPRKFAMIKAVCDYYTLTRPMIQWIIGVKNDRAVRDDLSVLTRDGFIQKTRMQAVNPSVGNPAPVYFPSRKGAEYVAAETGDERYLRVCTKTPDWTHLWHWLGVSGVHITLDRAVALVPSVTVIGWYGEWDEVNPSAPVPQDRYRIYTLIREKPKLVCAPDACFALGIGQHSKTYYLELDRATSGIQQIAASKTPGYSALNSSGLHRRHFETTAESFTVLHLSPTPGRRDLLRRAITTKEGAELHRFASLSDWTPEKAITESIFYPCIGNEPQPLIRLPKGGGS